MAQKMRNRARVYLRLVKLKFVCVLGGQHFMGFRLSGSPVVCFYYRQDAAKRQTAGIKFTHRPKIRFFAQQGRLVAPIHVKLGKNDGHVGPLGSIASGGWECGPKNIKNFHFLVKSRPVGATPLTDFQNF